MNPLWLLLLSQLDAGTVVVAPDATVFEEVADAQVDASVDSVDAEVDAGFVFVADAEATDRGLDAGALADIAAGSMDAGSVDAAPWLSLPSGPTPWAVDWTPLRLPKFPWFNDLRLLVLMIVLAPVAARLATVLRQRLRREGVLPRALSAANRLFRFAGLAAAGLLVLQLAPEWMGPTVPFVLFAAAAAVGWSVRDIVQDLMAAAVLLTERRVRPGTWVEGEGFAGVVYRLGPRATWLRDRDDRLITVPNRRLLQVPVASELGPAPWHETNVRLVSDLSPEALRLVLREAVVASPWVPPDPALMVHRDASDPSLWRVRVRILDIAFADRFDGELLERAEEMARWRKEHETKPKKRPPDKS